MRSISFVASLIAVAAFSFACSSAGPAEAAIPSPSGSPSPTPIPPFDGPVLDIAAKGQAYLTLELEAKSGTPFRIMFENRDTQLAHNIAIARGGRDAELLFKGTIFHGPGTYAYDVPPLEAGTYDFFCIPHANMNGKLVVD